MNDEDYFDMWAIVFDRAFSDDIDYFEDGEELTIDEILQDLNIEVVE